MLPPPRPIFQFQFKPFQNVGDEAKKRDGPKVWLELLPFTDWNRVRIEKLLRSKDAVSSILAAWDGKQWNIQKARKAIVSKNGRLNDAEFREPGYRKIPQSQRRTPASDRALLMSVLGQESPLKIADWELKKLSRALVAGKSI